MASKTKPPVATEKETETPSYITEAQLDTKLAGFLDQVAALVKKPEPEPVAETLLAKEIRKAGPDPVQTNPEWDEKAREILGNAVDHTEYKYLKTGGVVFTVVIAQEHSNAPQAYLEQMGTDRRSKEIGQEGTQGVEAWCKLVKQNLSKMQNA